MLVRCSVAADAAGDAREGTAPQALQWFLMEHRGPWGPNALADSHVDPATVAALTDWADAVGGRILLIRPHGRTAPGHGRRWFRIDAQPGHESIRTGTFHAERALDPDLPGLEYPGPLHLVCAHGKHDTCCAVRGRALAAALTSADPEHTWECSHVGGCRFAPAVVLLPHGYVLGGAPAADAAALVAGYRAGVIDPRWLRGRSSLPPAAQAAQHHARAKTGALGVDALTPVEVSGSGPRWRVSLVDPDCTVVLHERLVIAGRPLTCAASVPGRMRVFDLVDLRVE